MQLSINGHLKCLTKLQPGKRRPARTGGKNSASELNEPTSAKLKNSESKAMVYDGFSFSGWPGVCLQA